MLVIVSYSLTRNNKNSIILPSLCDFVGSLTLVMKIMMRCLWELNIVFRNYNKIDKVIFITDVKLKVLILCAQKNQPSLLWKGLYFSVPRQCGQEVASSTIRIYVSNIVWPSGYTTFSTNVFRVECPLLSCLHVFLLKSHCTFCWNPHIHSTVLLIIPIEIITRIPLAIITLNEYNQQQTVTILL